MPPVLLLLPCPNQDSGPSFTPLAKWTERHPEIYFKYFYNLHMAANDRVHTKYGFTNGISYQNINITVLCQFLFLSVQKLRLKLSQEVIIGQNDL